VESRISLAVQHPDNQGVELSAKLFKQIVSALRADALSAQRERRVSPRVGLSASVQIFLRSGDGRLIQCRVRLHDFSRHGLCILYSQSLRVSSNFVLRLPDVDDGPMTLLCTVRNCRGLGEGRWAIGATFDEVVAGATRTPAASPVIATKATVPLVSSVAGPSENPFPSADPDTTAATSDVDQALLERIKRAMLS
jgi:hypothetical protein